MRKSVPVFLFLLLATLSAIFEPTRITILGLCAASFLLWLFGLFSWADRFREKPGQSTRLYISFFILFYLLIIYSFGLAHYAASGVDCVGTFNRIKAVGNYLYFSVATATTLGYGDMTPSEPLAKFLSVLEVSFGVIFITAILTVVLAFRDVSTTSNT
jgi:voltage-gated potassium channel Kch